MRARIVVLALMMSPLLVGQAQSRAKTKEPARAESRGKDSRGKVEQQGGERGNNDSSCEKGQNQQGQHEGQHEDGKCAPATKPPVPPVPPVVPPVPVVGVAQIHGTVFNDLNANGKFDFNELGLAGWTITLSGPVTASAVTAWDGTYALTALPVGTYTVCSVAQVGWTATAPATPCWSLDVPATMPDLWYGSIDFGVK